MTDSESKIRQELDGLVAQAKEQAVAANDLAVLDDVRVRYLERSQLRQLCSIVWADFIVASRRDDQHSAEDVRTS